MSSQSYLVQLVTRYSMLFTWLTLSTKILYWIHKIFGIKFSSHLKASITVIIFEVEISFQGQSSYQKKLVSYHIRNKKNPHRHLLPKIIRYNISQRLSFSFWILFKEHYFGFSNHNTIIFPLFSSRISTLILLSCYFRLSAYKIEMPCKLWQGYFNLIWTIFFLKRTY